MEVKQPKCSGWHLPWDLATLSPYLNVMGKFSGAGLCIMKFARGTVCGEVSSPHGVAFEAIGLDRVLSEIFPRCEKDWGLLILPVPIKKIVAGKMYVVVFRNCHGTAGSFNSVRRSVLLRPIALYKESIFVRTSAKLILAIGLKLFLMKSFGYLREDELDGVHISSWVVAWLPGLATGAYLGNNEFFFVDNVVYEVR